jgi:hypothetical protein
VPAIVGERTQHAVVVAAQQDAAVADGLGALIGRVRQLGAEAHARPASAEEILLFPAEDGGIYASGRGQLTALAERLGRVSKSCGTDGACVNLS